MRTEGRWIKDEAGRTLILRGANLSGSAKVPLRPDGSTWRRDGYYDWKGVSFVDRPVPLEQTDEHFERLASWGMTFLRFLVTWEAIEHDGPGVYDDAYLDYVRAVLERARRHGISVFVDPHQDVWSRWTGGDGAPAWTLELLGMDVRRLHETGAAFVHQEAGDPFPRMIWPTNAARYGAQTLFTLFFAGDAFAPRTLVEGEPVQQFLQRRFLGSMTRLARRLEGLDNVVGFDAFNEPSAGYTGLPDLRRIGNVPVLSGCVPTPFEGMAAASGRPTRAAVWKTGALGTRVVGHRTVNPKGISLFREGFQCPWRHNGVWDEGPDGPRLLRPDHFARFQGAPADFAARFLVPFQRRFAQEIRAVLPDALVFLEGVPEGAHPPWSAADGDRVVHAFHWYDGATLFTKLYVPFFSVRADTRRPVLGREAVRRSYAEQIADAVRWTDERMGGLPCLVGEFGAPYDLNGGRGLRTRDWRMHVEALDGYYAALDASLVSGTIWNYTPDNTHARGDQWNGEDLSIYCAEDGGGRAVEGFCRPYAMRTAGTPLAMGFDRRSGRFELRFRADPAVAAPTEVYAPLVQYPRGVRAHADGGRVEVRASEQRVLLHEVREAREHRLVLERAG